MAFFGFDASRHNTAAPGFSQINDPFAGLSSGAAVDDALEFEDTYDGLGDALEETGDDFNDDTFGGGAGDGSGGSGAFGGGGGGGGFGGSAGRGGNTGAYGSSAKVGTDFDFFGQTAKVADAIEEEHARFNRLQPAARTTAAAAARGDRPDQPPAPAGHQYDFFAPAAAPRPARSGYEKYKEPEPDMQVDAALWGVAPKKPAAAAAAASSSEATTTPKPGAGSRKVLSLEEVEAAMRAQSKKPAAVSQPPPPPMYQQPPPLAPPPADYGHGMPAQELVGEPVPAHGHHPGHPVAILQRPQPQQTPPALAQGPPPFQHPPPHPQQQHHAQHAPPAHPTQILQNPNRHPGAGVDPGAPFGGAPSAAYPGPPPHPQPPQHQHHHQHQRQASSFSGPQIITHPSQVVHLSEGEKAAYMEQEARRAKRNHKIFLLSKNNGLMTPQDKNFVTRIQLQQLVSATGNPNDHGTDEALKEDFYYQVLIQIRGSTRQHPSQPLNNFAQTYLFQTGSRFHSRRYMNRDRGADNHVQRMEQQVQRAVEAAKNRPKNKQLVIEGTLGKISFSNAKTPKPLLNIKRAEGSSGAAAAAAGGGSGGGAATNGHSGSSSGSVSGSHDGGAGSDRPASAYTKATGAGAGAGRRAALDRRAVLRSIEKVYATLMEIEDHDRKMPPPVVDQGDLDLIQRHVEWTETMQALSARLWRELKVHEPIGEFPVHPFIAFLSVPKGKKAIPRVFRHLSHELRATVLTIIVVHLDQLDIVRNAQVDGSSGNSVPQNASQRESIELFILTVVNTLFNFMNELSLDLVTGVLGLILNLNVAVIAKSRIGASMLTMILSRAELIKQAAGGTPQQWQTWERTYTSFFHLLEPTLPHMFPGTVSSGEDVYVWQLLAALGIGANPDQQQRLVLAVKDRVMDTVAAAKTLPVDLATQRLQSVNLFMRSIGLDVELLQ